jgi:hypothetical protein
LTKQTTSTVPAPTPTEPYVPTPAEAAATKRETFLQKVEDDAAKAKAKVVGAVKEIEEKFCEVCGFGSHRLDWQKISGPVYCDNHKHTSTTGSTTTTTTTGTTPTPVSQSPATGGSPAPTQTGQATAIKFGTGTVMSVPTGKLSQPGTPNPIPQPSTEVPKTQPIPVNSPASLTTPNNTVAPVTSVIPPKV